MDINARLQQLEEILQDAKSMPLSSSHLVNREELLEIIDAAREGLPEEIKQARWVVKDREELLAKARRDAEAIVDKAHAERAWILSEKEVVRSAQETADRIVGEAEERAREMRLEAEDYVDAKLAQFEIALERTRAELEKSIAQVVHGRERLRGMSPAEEEFGGSRHDEPAEVFDAEELEGPVR